MRRWFLGGSAAAILIASPFVATWEGKRNDAYLDTGGVPTACYGYTHGVELGQIYSDAECDDLLALELLRADAAIKRLVRVPLSDKTRAALISFIYNVGEGAFERSTLLRKLNARDYAGACNELPRWVYDNGRRINGLVNRREAERKLCMGGLQ